MSETPETTATPVSNRQGGWARRWRQRLDASPHQLAFLFGLSFLETIVLPVPIELILIPYMAGNRDRLWRTALVVTLGCLAGSLVGYGVGHFVFETVGIWLIDAMGWSEAYQAFQAVFDAHGFWAILAIGVTPLPFQVALLAAGAAAYPVSLFVLAATLARGVRYFGLALLVCLFGRRAVRLWNEHRMAAAALAAGVVGLLWLAAETAGSWLLS